MPHRFPDNRRALLQDRKRLLAELRKHPDSHWLLTRVSTTYYECRDYATALQYAEHAWALCPRCPLVAWDLAGALQMLGRAKEADSHFRRLIRRGAPAIAVGHCGEGLPWARSLVADCWYRRAVCAIQLARPRQAVAYFENHLQCRAEGARSLYHASTVQRELRAVRRSLTTNPASNQT